MMLHIKNELKYYGKSAIKNYVIAILFILAFYLQLGVLKVLNTDKLLGLDLGSIIDVPVLSASILILMAFILHIKVILTNLFEGRVNLFRSLNVSKNEIPMTLFMPGIIIQFIGVFLASFIIFLTEVWGQTDTNLISILYKTIKIFLLSNFVIIAFVHGVNVLPIEARKLFRKATLPYVILLIIEMSFVLTISLLMIINIDRVGWNSVIENNDFMIFFGIASVLLLSVNFLSLRKVEM